VLLVRIHALRDEQVGPRHHRSFDVDLVHMLRLGPQLLDHVLSGNGVTALQLLLDQTPAPIEQGVRTPIRHAGEVVRQRSRRLDVEAWRATE